LTCEEQRASGGSPPRRSQTAGERTLCHAVTSGSRHPRFRSNTRQSFRERFTMSSSSILTIKRVAGHIGAEITGVDLAHPLDPTTVEEIRQALLAHKVVFFRGQTLDHSTQIAFARQFGELTHAHPHEDAPPEEHPQILTIDPRRYEERYGANYRELYRKRQYSYYSGWHTDVTAAVNPPAASILRAETVPDFGGDTQWTN